MGRSSIINDFDWGDPVIPIHRDPEWEAEVKSELGFVTDLLKRVSPSPWIRKACLKWPTLKVTMFPRKLGDIATLVTAQENACRYCFGVARSQMQLYGYSGKMISSIERKMHVADLDEKERTFIRFCRDLARSNPRPPKEDMDKLASLGFSKLAVTEMAFHIANSCFINRVATFISSPPMYQIENLSGSFLFGRILRPLIARLLKSKEWTSEDAIPEGTKSFPGVVDALSGTAGAVLLNEALEGAFSSNILSKELKVLMFAVISRSLDCAFCQAETGKMAKDLGFKEDEYEKALLTLTSPRLNAVERKILTWTRETVHFQTGTIQKHIRGLAKEVESTVLLESIGVAALANTTVRLAVLLG